MNKLKTAIFYFDAQNLYRRAKEVFPNVKYPNFDPIALSKLVAQKYSLKVKTIKFYTGVPPKKRNPYWNKFWSKKLAILGKIYLIKSPKIKRKGWCFYIKCVKFKLRSWRL